MATDDTYIDELNQLRDRQTAVLDEIDKIRDRFGILPAAIERIQGDALKIVHDIDEIRERRKDELHAGPFSTRQLHLDRMRASAGSRFYLL